MKIVASLFGLLFAMALLATVLGLAVGLLATAVAALRARWVPVIYNVRSLTRRKLTTTFTVLGMALVVFVFSTVLMLQSGIRRTLVSAGETDNVVVLRKGATLDITSFITYDQARLLAARPEVALDGRDGKPLADPEVAVLIFA